MRAPSLPALIALSGARIAPPAPFANVSLNSDVALGNRRGRTLDRRSALAPSEARRQRLRGHARLSGRPSAVAVGNARDRAAHTLAPFLDRAPKLLDAHHGWSGRADRASLRRSDRARLANFPRRTCGWRRSRSTNAALSIMTRDQRTEIALVEGQGLRGGTSRAASPWRCPGTALSLRGAGSLTRCGCRDVELGRLRTPDRPPARSPVPPTWRATATAPRA